MAKVFGESGAWKALLDSLSWTGVKLDRPESISLACEALMAQRDKNIAKEREALSERVSAIEEQISLLQKDARFLNKLFPEFCTTD